MDVVRRKFSKKEQVLNIFNKLFFKNSLKFTSSELLQIAEDIVSATYKVKKHRPKDKISVAPCNYFVRDSYQMISENPWEVAARENELINFKEYKSDCLEEFLWRK